KARARELGFTLSGVAPAADADGFAHFRDWLGGGVAGEMDYLHTQGEARRHPRSILESVRSVVMLGMEYQQRGARNPELGTENQEPRFLPLSSVPRSAL